MIRIFQKLHKIAKGVAAMKTEREIITSRQNSAVSYVCKLSNKKYRDAERKFRIDGIKLFEEAVLSNINIENVFLRSGSLERVLPVIDKSPIKAEKIKVLSNEVFEKISEEKSPDGIICVAEYIDGLHRSIKTDRDTSDIADLLSGRIFAVESVRDPGNIGTIIRTAAAFGIDSLLLSNDCADIYNPRTLRAAMGALFRQRIILVDDMSCAVKKIKALGRRVYAAALGESSQLLGREPLGEADCIVVGNEGHGISRETAEACDGSILIPMMPEAESLNVAVAAAVCMWEQFGRLIKS